MRAWFVRSNFNNLDVIDRIINELIIIFAWRFPAKHNCFEQDSEKLWLQNHYGLSSINLGAADVTRNIFADAMAPGDIVLIPSGENIYITKIKSKLIENECDDGTYEWIREIEPVNKFNRKDLSNSLRSALRLRRPVGDLNKFIEELESLYSGNISKDNASVKSSLSREVEFPLRDDFQIKFNIPVDLNGDEADRIHDFLKLLIRK